MAKRKPLDPYTCRRVAVRLRKRANQLRAGHQYKDVTWGRAAEADLQADWLLEQARALKPAKRTKQ